MDFTGKQLDGEIVRWLDDRGFGFIRSKAIEQEVFFHIRAYRAPNKRPQVGDYVVFVAEKNQKGKLQAVQVQERQFVQRKQMQQRRHVKQQAAFESGQSLRLVAVLVLYGLLASLVFSGKWPPVVWLWYAALGVLTFLAYRKDKAAAQQGSWRTPENTLHLLSLLGGWPGAWLAQTYLRHKSQKAEFRVIYYATVVINVVLLIYAAKYNFFF